MLSFHKPLQMIIFFPMRCRILSTRAESFYLARIQQTKIYPYLPTSGDFVEPSSGLGSNGTCQLFHETVLQSPAVGFLSVALRLDCRVHAWTNQYSVPTLTEYVLPENADGYYAYTV
jgi:hypothetical protein